MKRLLLACLLLGPLQAQAQGTNVLTGQVTVTCGTGSTSLLAAFAANQTLIVHVPAGGSNVVWFNFNGQTATAASPNFDLSAGQTLTFTAPGVVPAGAINCISAPAGQAVTVLYK